MVDSGAVPRTFFGDKAGVEAAAAAAAVEAAAAAVAAAAAGLCGAGGLPGFHTEGGGLFRGGAWQPD